MRRKIRYYRRLWLKHDLPAGLSVFLVALPLCLGIALASGAPLYAGLLSGIIGGLVVSIISGSQLAVSGPAAGLTTIVAASIISLGDYKLFFTCSNCCRPVSTPTGNSETWRSRKLFSFVSY
ncbi:MAG: SulP family inorganic anion transporter [Chitinophagaceae bacterium]|nr:SulP family inorganic anion transporter [Chitinophagaceae bacterium]